MCSLKGFSPSHAVVLAQCLPVEEVTQPFCSVSLDDSLTPGLTTELVHVLRVCVCRGGGV